MKTPYNTLTWSVIYYNFNANKMETRDVLKHSDELIRRLKKECKTIDEFSSRLRGEFMRLYWSRCEWEIVVEISGDNRIWIIPWCGRNAGAPRVDVTDRSDFDWRGFAEYHISRQINGRSAKVDVFDQVDWRWRDFVNYCWQTRLKYERDDPKFHAQL